MPGCKLARSLMRCLVSVKRTSEVTTEEPSSGIPHAVFSGLLRQEPRRSATNADHRISARSDAVRRRLRRRVTSRLGPSGPAPSFSRTRNRPPPPAPLLETIASRPSRWDGRDMLLFLYSGGNGAAGSPFFYMVIIPYHGEGGAFRMGRGEGSPQPRQARRLLRRGAAGFLRSTSRDRGRPRPQRGGEALFLLRPGERRCHDGALHLASRENPHFRRGPLAERKENP